MLASDVTLRITEIFCSIQGESSLAGEPTVFVRLTGCPLRCVYCDTEYAFQGGKTMTLKEIVEAIDKFQVPRVCVTGGEPLAQPGCLRLLTVLCDADYTVSLETSGALDVTTVDARVKRIVDLKTPSSGEESKNRYQDIDALTKLDEIKFVIASIDDYQWAVAKLAELDLQNRAPLILFSPVFATAKEGSPELGPTQLAEWIIRDQLPVRFQLQLHKLLWGDEPGH